MAKTASNELVGIDLVKAAMLDRNVKLSVNEEDPEVVQRRIVERTLNAQTIDDIWDSGTTAAKDIIDRPFKLHDVEFRNSEVEASEGGLPVFAVMHVAFLDTGETGIVTCGAAGVVTRLVKLIEFDALPYDVKISAKKTRAGYTVMDLEPVKARDGF
jgi:hypothetical protein